MNVDMILKLDDSIRNGITNKSDLKKLFDTDEQADVDFYLKNTFLEEVFFLLFC